MKSFRVFLKHSFCASLVSLLTLHSAALYAFSCLVNVPMSCMFPPALPGPWTMGSLKTGIDYVVRCPVNIMWGTEFAPSSCSWFFFFFLQWVSGIFDFSRCSVKMCPKSSQEIFPEPSHLFLHIGAMKSSSCNSPGFLPLVFPTVYLSLSRGLRFGVSPLG